MASGRTDGADFSEERILIDGGSRRIAGVDEAGRGPLAGPVTAAAMIFPPEWICYGLPPELSGLNDSKQLTASQREVFFEFLTTQPELAHSVETIEAGTIDQMNILEATHQAMNRALARLSPPPEHVLVDGLSVKSMKFAQTALVKGDGRSYSIAAASVLAKVTRDRLMLRFDQLYPEYGFAEHKGYGTARHLEALRRLGPCPIHRRSFAPVRLEQPELFT